MKIVLYVDKPLNAKYQTLMKKIILLLSLAVVKSKKIVAPTGLVTDKAWSFRHGKKLCNYYRYEEEMPLTRWSPQNWH
jgi:hypothetical protein